MDELDLLDVAFPSKSGKTPVVLPTSSPTMSGRPLGRCALRADGNRRRWDADRLHRANDHRRCTGSSRYDVGVSPTILTFVDTAASLGQRSSTVAREAFVKAAPALA